MCAKGEGEKCNGQPRRKRRLGRCPNQIPGTCRKTGRVEWEAVLLLQLTIKRQERISLSVTSLFHPHDVVWRER